MAGDSDVGDGGCAETPFDLEKLRLSQDFVSELGAKKALLTVPVRKAGRQEFVRVHPDERMRLETAVIHDKDDGKFYLVARTLWHELSLEVVPILLLLAVNRQGILFLWPIRLPDAEGRHDEWNRSAMEAATIAEERWVRLVSNRPLGAYEVLEAQGNLPEPEWPDKGFDELLRLAFKDRFINSLDHPVIKRLKGQA